MKAEELRIGNYYRDYGNRLMQVDLKFFNILHSGVEVDEVVKSYEPLTEEWLLKFGFEKDVILFSIRENDEWKSRFTIQYDRDKELYKTECQGYWYHIKCVHQLQNLYFALTGTELTLNQ